MEILQQIIEEAEGFIRTNIAILWVITFPLVLILLIVVIVFLVKNRRLARKFDLFMRGKTGETLEDSIDETNRLIKLLQQEDQNNKADIAELKKVTARTFQRMAIVRYNAFPGMGGNSSCAIALLTQSLDGIVLNIVHSRESCYIYVKSVKKGEAEVLLGKEEKEALEEALKEKPIEL